MPTRKVALTDYQATLMEQPEAEDAQGLEALRSAVPLWAPDIAAGRFKSFDTKASLRTSGLLAAVKVMPGQRFDSKSLQSPSTTFNCTQLSMSGGSN